MIFKEICDDCGDEIGHDGMNFIEDKESVVCDHCFEFGNYVLSEETSSRFSCKEVMGDVERNFND